MSAVLAVFSGCMGFVLLGWISGYIMGRSRGTQELDAAADEGYRQGLRRGRDECQAVQTGTLQYRTHRGDRELKSKVEVEGLDAWAAEQSAKEEEAAWFAGRLKLKSQVEVQEMKEGPLEAASTSTSHFNSPERRPA